MSTATKPTINNKVAESQSDATVKEDNKEENIHTVKVMDSSIDKDSNHNDNSSLNIVNNNKFDKYDLKEMETKIDKDVDISENKNALNSTGKEPMGDKDKLADKMNLKLYM